MGLPKLYLIGTPLGNVEDITLRARRLFGELTHFFAEDTRELMGLLNHLQISVAGKKLHSFSAHNMKEATARAIRLLEDGEEIGLSTDRGMPGISDPGALLVEAVRAQGFEVVPVPGPSAVTTLFSVSGVSQSEFFFVGFLPSGPKARGELWAEIRALGRPACFLESPNRISQTLNELSEAFPRGRVFVGREMTKQFEQYRWVELGQDTKTEIPDKGEFTLLLLPGPKVMTSQLEEEITLRMATDKEWSKHMAVRYSMSASDAYNALHDARRKLDK